MAMEKMTVPAHVLWKKTSDMLEPYEAFHQFQKRGMHLCLLFNIMLLRVLRCYHALRGQAWTVMELEMRFKIEISMTTPSLKQFRLVASCTQAGTIIAFLSFIMKQCMAF
jgi:hypothetical protein